MAEQVSFAPKPTEKLGQRIAQLRLRRGWTQERLAERIAASRAAVSQFEAGLALPSERTIVLLAGLFRMEPHALVEGTGYPAAKTERLPPVACRYTEAELQLALLQRDVEWSRRSGVEVDTLVAHWGPLLDELEGASADPEERAMLRAAREQLLSTAGVPR